VKGADNIALKHIKGLKAFGEEYETKKRMALGSGDYLKLIKNKNSKKL
jgi:hypothetical protein